jgi:hypothetical protein
MRAVDGPAPPSDRGRCARGGGCPQKRSRTKPMRATLLFVIAAAAGLALVSAQTGGCSDPECRCSGWAFIDEECQRCPAGTFQGIGMGSFHECLVCSPPLTSAEGSTTCGCAAGRYMDLQASDEEEDVDIRCPKCQAGFYNPSIGQTTCLNCPPGARLPNPVPRSLRRVLTAISQAPRPRPARSRVIRSQRRPSSLAPATASRTARYAASRFRALPLGCSSHCALHAELTLVLRRVCLRRRDSPVRSVVAA